jgi:hypothetical protein
MPTPGHHCPQVEDHMLAATSRPQPISTCLGVVAFGHSTLCASQSLVVEEPIDG